MTLEEALSAAKPILFNTKMVRAIQGGRKTVTRRVIKPRFRENECGFFTATIAGRLFLCYSDEDDNETRRVKSPYQINDILYVRETWAYIQYMDISGCVYKASAQAERVVRVCANKGKPLKWSPSIHMPKEAARIFLRVTNVRAEWLQDITEKQAIAEGIRIGMGGEPYFSCRAAYAPLWNSTVKKSDLDKYGWAANPWVWVIEFERVEVTE